MWASHLWRRLRASRLSRVRRLRVISERPRRALRGVGRTIREV